MASGIKTSGLGAYGDLLDSADSIAWSFRARRSPALPGCSHRSCANCRRFAVQWRARPVLVRRAAGTIDWDTNAVVRHHMSVVTRALRPCHNTAPENSPHRKLVSAASAPGFTVSMINPEDCHHVRRLMTRRRPHRDQQIRGVESPQRPAMAPPWSHSRRDPSTRPTTARRRRCARVHSGPAVMGSRADPPGKTDDQVSEPDSCDSRSGRTYPLDDLRYPCASRCPARGRRAKRIQHTSSTTAG
ncbi:DUF7221 family queuine tRNA-ribosyltransferase-like protein [Nocardia fluminea]|uniref:deazapurine DNA modification protein DpdA family protein n=1 Tax=Nocardia fluminea TaxID=134984 RepID=UPI003D124368